MCGSFPDELIEVEAITTCYTIGKEDTVLRLISDLQSLSADSY